MKIYFLLLIPTFASLYLLLRYRKRVHALEIGGLFLIALVTIFVSKFTTEKVMTRDLELWGNQAHHAIFDEPWNEKVSCRHEISCTHPIPCTHTDKKGNKEHSNDGYQHSNDGYQHPFDVDDHPAELTVDADGHSFPISYDLFNHLCAFWKNKKFVEMNRPSYTKDGDRYVTDFPGDSSLIYPVITEHTYENRIQASTSVFRFPDVKPETVKQYGLYQPSRPDSNFQAPCVLGYNSPKADLALNQLNAVYGPDYQIRMYVLIFRDQPVEASVYQEALWQGGNKNEFVTCIGLDSSNLVQWAYCFAWENDLFKRQSETQVMTQRGKKLDLRPYFDYLRAKVPTSWKRKPFADFSYLTVEPPTSHLILATIFMLLMTFGYAFWAVNNRIDLDAPLSLRPHRYFPQPTVIRYGYKTTKRKRRL